MVKDYKQTRVTPLQPLGSWDIYIMSPSGLLAAYIQRPEAEYSGRWDHVAAVQ